MHIIEPDIPICFQQVQTIYPRKVLCLIWRKDYSPNASDNIPIVMKNKTIHTISTFKMLYF